MKLVNSDDIELWRRVATARSAICLSNGATYRPGEVADYADRVVEEFRKRVDPRY